jgi:thiol-disulfide isomerase/thioredoxin
VIDGPAALPEPPRRAGGIGPFSWRQLAGVAGAIGVAALVLTIVTRPIAAGPIAPTALPAATAFVVGSPGVGLSVGDVAPELDVVSADGSRAPITDLDGQPIRLADLRGKVVWVNFWATWCPPCQSETPVLRDLADRYRDRGLVVVGIAVQETTVDDVRAYAARYELRYPIAFDASADAFGTYRVFALPTQFIIGTDGRIVQVVNGPVTDASAAALLAQLGL